MTWDLASRLDPGPSGLVAFVGAGGKTTLTFRLAAELAALGRRVVVTTTTKMGADQVPPGGVASAPSPAAVARALEGSMIVLAAESADGHKATGPAPGDVAALLTDTQADYVLVEADGARRLPLKAPADHEPVIPAGTTLVVVCAGLDALGRSFGAACHRPELGAALAGRAVTDPIRPEDMAAVLAHPAGGLKGAPREARVVVALTKAAPGEAGAAAISERLRENGRIERIVVVPRMGSEPGRSTGG